MAARPSASAPRVLGAAGAYIQERADIGGVTVLLQGALVFAIAVAPIAFALALVRRRGVARLDAAAGLVLWGLLIVVLEHAWWGVTEFGGRELRTHEGFHFEMLAAFGLTGLALVAVVVAPLIRRGDAAGWRGLLVLLVAALGAEVAAATVTTPHGVPPRWWIAGVFLWGYPVSWGAALVLSYRSVFAGGPERRDAAPAASRPRRR